MLKTTHTPSAAAKAPLPSGWTEHKAPTGHTYYYNSETKESTYRRPSAADPVFQPSEAGLIRAQYGGVPNLSDPNVANAYLTQLRRPLVLQSGMGRDGSHRGRDHGRNAHQRLPRQRPIDKPIRREDIPGCHPWVLVYTKYSRRFVYNPEKNASFWRIPDKLKSAILELDKSRILQKNTDCESTANTEIIRSGQVVQIDRAQVMRGEDGNSSEYEEIEVTDDDDAASDETNTQRSPKRSRLFDSSVDEEKRGTEPVEFTEDDIAAQIQAIAGVSDYESGGLILGNAQDWSDTTEPAELSEDDAMSLFKDLLNDVGVSPYSPWAKILEDGKIIDDPRYTALPTTRKRKECWDEWSRERIAQLKEHKAKQAKANPRVAYMAFLQENATPKLYWPEFKRKYRKEEVMKDFNLSDKDREKAFREYISRLKLPQETLKSDFITLLKEQPINVLHRNSLSTGFPDQILTDARYISIAPSMRDALVEAYVQTLPAPPEDFDDSEEGGKRRKEREARKWSETALHERNRVVNENRSGRERDDAASKARLREKEKDLEDVIQVSRSDS